MGLPQLQHSVVRLALSGSERSTGVRSHDRGFTLTRQAAAAAVHDVAVSCENSAAIRWKPTESAANTRRCSSSTLPLVLSAS